MPVLGAAPEAGDTGAVGGVYGGQHLDSSVMRCLHSRSIGPGNVTSQALHTAHPVSVPQQLQRHGPGLQSLHLRALQQRMPLLLLLPPALLTMPAEDQVCQTPCHSQGTHELPGSATPVAVAVSVAVVAAAGKIAIAWATTCRQIDFGGNFVCLLEPRQRGDLKKETWSNPMPPQQHQ